MEENKVKVSKKNKGLLNILIVVVLTGLVIFFTFKNDGKAVLEELYNVRWTFLVLAVFVQIMNPLLDGLALMLLIRRFKKDYTFKEAYINNLIGLFFCYITPSQTGGQIAQISIFKKQHVDRVKATSSLIVDFLVFSITMIIYGGITLFLNYSYMVNNLPAITLFNREWSFLTLAIIGFILYFFAGFGLMLLSYSRIVNAVAKWLIRLLGKMKIVKDPEARLGEVDNKVKSFKENLNDFVKSPLLALKLILVKIGRLTAHFFIPYLCCLAVGLEITSSQIFIIFALTCYHQVITTFVPIPGGSGGSELFFILLFTPIFKENIAGLKSAMIIWRAISFYLPLIYSSIVMFTFNKEARINVIDFIPEKHRYFFYNDIDKLEEQNNLEQEEIKEDTYGQGF